MTPEHPFPAIIILCVSLIFLSEVADANSNTFKVASPPFAPFSFFKEDDQCTGITIEILNRIAKLSGLNFQHVRYPYARILSSLKNGEVDMALVFKNASVNGYVDYIGPVSKSRIVVLTRFNNPIKKYQDLHKLKAIAVIRKAQFENTFDIDKKINRFSVESYLRALKMFEAERVDAVAGSFFGLEYSMKQLNMDPKLLDNIFILGYKEWWLHISNKSSIITLNNNVKSKIAHAVSSIYKPRLSYQIYKQQIEKCQI